ncbi:class I SAM-dependent methyltransferase [Moorena producens JHB]|uniref:Class I SAM-dependent methyltransferase n=1 Tax=Moorena producens (strain JHB) TaxID=1454205 RepID=A0A1D9FZF1_MOOP1|nr:class I SAM-dependent methyltransferase [Moorena producens]AOY80723.1 class I SAM-dependent methyltransferase [Moorena producens JHB]
MQNVDFEIQIPEIDSARNLPIHEEYFWLIQNGTKRKIRLHDYVEVYQIPYLYEHLMDKLDSQSHTVLTSLLVEQFTQAGGTVEDMVVLDMGAGSGLVGKTLADLGVKSIVGIDIIPEAAEAAQRQYPGVYEDYHVGDLANLTETTKEALSRRGFNCLICCSALSNGHVPADALSVVYNQTAPDGWIAFNVAQYFWKDHTETGFQQQHPWVTDQNIFEVVQIQPYRHRFYTDGRPLEYVAIIGRKRSSIL